MLFLLYILISFLIQTAHISAKNITDISIIKIFLT